MVQETNSYSRVTAVSISAILFEEEGGGHVQCGVTKPFAPCQFAAHRWLSRFPLERHLVDLLLGVVLVQRHLPRTDKDFCHDKIQRETPCKTTFTEAVQQ